MADNRLGSLAKQTAIYGLSSIIGIPTKSLPNRAATAS